jgi:crotonobetainyl-CoA:carnitine CoA-transferase CaiB-like acyl-CoA transferase
MSAGRPHERSLPLSGVRVLDFSSLLPGPLTSLLLAEAGAEVLQVERPPRGDEMRSYVPRLGESSANYALLNRGKRSAAVEPQGPGRA